MIAADWFEWLLAGLCFGVVMGFLWGVCSLWADPRERERRRKERERQRRLRGRLRRIEAIRRERQEQERWELVNKPAWEVNDEVEIYQLVRHSEFAKRMKGKYATELQDEELARTVKRLLERRRVEIVTGDTAG